MARIPWVLEDPADSSTYSFAINPNEGGSPSYEKSISSKRTVAPDGAPVFYEGQAESKPSEASGVLRTKAQYAALLIWFKKRRVLQLTDDLGRVQTIVLEAFIPTRKRSATAAYRHDFTIRWTVLSITDLDEMP